MRTYKSILINGILLAFKILDYIRTDKLSYLLFNPDNMHEGIYNVEHKIDSYYKT